MNATKSNLKKIRIDDLTIGMFIVNIGRSWFTHPFLRNQLKITSEKQLQKMRKFGILEVYIDPGRGIDVPSPEATPEPSPELSPDPSPETSLEVSPAPNTVESVASLPESLEKASPGPPPEKLEEKPMPAPPENSGETSGGALPEEFGKADESLFPNGMLPPIHRGEQTVPVRQLEKSESVVFWEQNIGKVQENLLALRAPVAAPSVAQVPNVKEIDAARVIQQEAQTLIRNIMQDVRMGKSIESERVKRAVNGMVDSILRNEDALLRLTRIKRYDEYTYVHSLDVCILSLSMGRHLGFSREEMLEIGIGALMHDVGKMKISPQIIKKPDALTEEEWVEVRKHPIYSLEILEESKGIPEQSKQIALQHHERYNGKGYPFGLSGDSIGAFAQVAGIIDVYSAITNDRYYRKGAPPHEGIKQIYEMAQVEFDRLLVERFIQCIGIYPFGTLVLLDSEEIGIVCGVNAEDLLRPNILIIHKNSKSPYSVPFMADLTEKSGNSHCYKRTVIMPLDPKKWNIRVDAYLSDILINLNGKWFKK